MVDVYQVTVGVIRNCLFTSCLTDRLLEAKTSPDVTMTIYKN